MLDASGPAYRIVESDEVEKLRASKNAARARWRMTHVALDSTARRDPVERDEADVFEAHGEHLAALQQWQRTEAHFIAARLGFRTDTLRPRR